MHRHRQIPKPRLSRGEYTFSGRPQRSQCGGIETTTHAHTEDGNKMTSRCRGPQAGRQTRSFPRHPRLEDSALRTAHAPPRGPCRQFLTALRSRRLALASKKPAALLLRTGSFLLSFRFELASQGPLDSAVLGRSVQWRADPAAAALPRVSAPPLEPARQETPLSAKCLGVEIVLP